MPDEPRIKPLGLFSFGFENFMTSGMESKLYFKGTGLNNIKCEDLVWFI